MAVRVWLVGLVALLPLVMLGGCHGAVHRLPEIAASDIEVARLDLQADTAVKPLRTLSGRRALRILGRAIDRVHDAGVAVCREIGVGTCDWVYLPVRDRSLNGGAGLDGEILVNLGIAERVHSEEAMALVIAHEMAHHAAGHPATALRFETAGWQIGWTIGHALDAFSGFGGGRGGMFTRWAVDWGRYIGRLAWSRQREREADTIAVLIAYRAGLDLDKARGLGLELAHEHESRRSGPFDSHPLGAERLAVIDRAIALVRATGGRLPPRADWPLAGLLP